MVILSILIPTIKSRRAKLSQLVKELSKQKKFIDENWLLGEIEILIDDSPKYLIGGPSIGMKRDSLVQQASGKYLCFLDDDESISGNYLQTLVRLTEQDKDVITFRSLANLDDYWCIVDMSIEHKENEQTLAEDICKRPPWHICPVKSSMAKVHKFEDTNYGEDWNWFERVLKGCESEAKTNAIIHMYNHRSKKSEADKITQSIDNDKNKLLYL